MKFAYIINEKSITLMYSDGTVDSVPAEPELVSALKEGRSETEVRNIADKSKCIANYMEGEVIVKNNQVLYHGQPMHGVLVSKILEFAAKGYPYMPLVKFFANIMKNPSNRAVCELYGFLSNAGLGITDSGTFLAYKAIKENWTDKHTGRFDNHIGCTLEMPRNMVDDNCNNGCSHGFHVGSLKYVTSFASASDHVIIVEVDPKDVVSVPTEDCGKVRVCKYRVVGEFTGELEPYSPLHEDSGQEVDEDYPDDCPDGGGAENEDQFTV